jgi:chromate transporter
MNNNEIKNTEGRVKRVLRLFLCMLKIGLFTFGGGYAMIALLEDEFVSKKNWLSRDEFLDMLAIAESTPGPIAINSATYIGFKVGGAFGSAMATLGVCIPSFVIIYTISLFFDAFLSIKYVQYAFKGIQVCVTYLILSAGIKMWKGIKKSLVNILLFGGVAVCMIALALFGKSISSIIYILAGGAVGLLIYLAQLLSGRGKEEKK